MDVNIELFKKVAATLPISYYTGREIPLNIDESRQDTYYDQLADTITLSYPMMSTMFGKLKHPSELESCIRAVLYHEVSHALLTPMGLMNFWCDFLQELMPQVINIFEDERIETILKNYYIGVDFKRNCILLNDYHGEDPQNAVQAFYQTVRFRTGKNEYVKRVHTIIEDNKRITSNKQYGYESYQRQIYDLFLDVCQDYLEEHEKDKLNQETNKDFGKDYDSCSPDQKMKAVKRIMEKEGAKQMQGLAGSGIPMGGEGKEGKEGEPEEGGKAIPGASLSEEEEGELRKLESYINKNEGDPVTEKPQNMLNTILNKFMDKSLTDEIAMLFENFTSRQKNNAGAMQRYSGVLNPRAIGVRKDWRVWEYKSQNGPVNGYDKLHLNLFIDTSGSFYENQDRVNTLLHSLTQLEKKYDFFEYDLVTCQCGEKLRSKEERYIVTGGGNDLDDNIHAIFKQLQTPNAVNYNIILFDGYAFTDAGYRGSNHEKNFSAFNSCKCSIISDSDNAEPINKYAPQAHKIIVDRYAKGNKSYSQMLTDNVVQAIQRALL